MLSRAERQSAWMSNISRDSLIQSGTRCFMLYPYGTMGIKELNMIWWRLVHSDICYFPHLTSPYVTGLLLSNAESLAVQSVSTH